jgi:putative copper export protein
MTVESPDAPPDRARPGADLLAAGGLLVAAVVVLVVAVLLSGGGPEPAPPGLPDAGPVVGWAVPVLRLAQHLAAVLTAGVLLAGLLPAGAGRRPDLPAWTVAAPAAAWSAAAAASVVAGLADVTGRPLGDVLSVDLVRSYAEQVATGRALLWTAALALAVAAAAPASRWLPGRAALLVVALGALVPPLRTGHAATAADHTLAVTALSAHVVAAVLWVGGLAALAAGRRSAWLAAALPRFSALALLCFTAVGASGLVAAWTRLPALSSLSSTGYGGLLLVKAATLLALGAAGWRHRRRTLPAVAGGSAEAFRRLAAAELGLMGAALALGVALTRASP